MSRSRTLANAVSGGSLLQSGDVAYFARSTPPSGWLKANGALVSRTTYAALFAAIGTTYGAGDGSTTFALPDLRGEFIRSLDDGRGVDTGRTLGSPQADGFKTHGHETARNASGGGQVGSFVFTTASALNTGTSVANTFIPTTNAGGDETRPRNVALLACIKT